MIIQGDFTENDWLLIVEDEGPRGLGRVLGYMVFETEADAQRWSLRSACDELNLFVDEDLPADVASEVMTVLDFYQSYGNRMPLSNRGKGER